MSARFVIQEREQIRHRKLRALAERPVQISFIGKPDASQKLWRGKAPRALEIDSASADAGVAATSSATFTLTANGTTVLTVAWAAGATAAVCTIVEESIPADAVLLLTAPASQDATLADGTILIAFGEGS